MGSARRERFDQNSHSGRSLDVRFGCALASQPQDDQLLIEQEVLRHAKQLPGHDGWSRGPCSFQSCAVRSATLSISCPPISDANFTLNSRFN